MAESLKNAYMLGFIVLLYSTKVFGLQRFSEQPKYTEVNPNQDALLVCKVIDRRGTCIWQKDNKPIGMYPKKYEWASTNTGMLSNTGDCSIWVRAATLEFDDGLWECQVTASDFTTQDALTSQPIRLVVRVAPQKPKLEHEGQHVLPGQNITVDTGATATVKCISHYGNPPAILKWFLGDQEIAPLHPQTNSTEADNLRTWSATSVVQIPATKDRHSAVLKCLAFHDYYNTRTVGIEARMDVRYAPSIKLLGSPQIDLEEGKDSLILRCEADANPPASIVWRRAGRSEIASLTESLQLRPVGRRDSGLYTCQAQNSVGTSDALSVQLDIKYPPRILSAGPDRLTTAPLFTPAAFDCIAEGNPSPSYLWSQKIPSQGDVWLERGRESRVVIDNVTYDYQGDYECRAYNFINGQERSTTSDPISLQVVGQPQVLRPNSSGYQVSVKRGESASLTLVVCADPRPRHVAWEWGSLRLEAGAGLGRFRVDDVTQDQREDCYLATLHINQADVQDSRPYYLVVENERGTDRFAISLKVDGLFPEPLELSYMLGIVVGCLAVLLIFMCACIYTIRAKKCCFQSRNNFKTSEKDSEKADLKPRHDIGVPHLDSIYTTTATSGFHHPHHPHHMNGNGLHQGSSEAMKSPAQRLSGQYAIIYPNRQDADLVLSTLRHQRDLFSGGVPVNTRVGSVVHAFENLAFQRQLKEGAEKPYESSKSSSSVDKKDSIYKINLPTTATGSAPLIVRHKAKKKAPEIPTLNAFTQTLYSADENESSAIDSLNIEDDNQVPTRNKKFPQSYVKNHKAVVPERQFSKILKKVHPLKENPIQSNQRYGVFLEPKNFSEAEIENDFLRGSTKSQSFIKNMAPISANSRKISTYEQNFLPNSEIKAQKPNILKKTKAPRKIVTSKLQEPLIDEVSLRYNEYRSNMIHPTSKIQNVPRQPGFQPIWNNQAEI